MWMTFRKGDIIYSKTLEQLRNDPVVDYMRGEIIEPIIGVKSSMNYEMTGKKLTISRDIIINVENNNAPINKFIDEGSHFWYSWMIDWFKSAKNSKLKSMEIE